MRCFRTLFPVALLFGLVLLLPGCRSDVPGWIDADRLRAADHEPENWMSLGRNFMQQHHSPLVQIHDTNVSELGLAWEYDARSRRGRVSRGLEATPIVVDGVMYTSGAWGVVYALDAKNGKEIWRYDPDVDGRSDRRACCDVVNRGVQVWEGRVYVATIDGYLVSLDAATGAVLWRIDTLIDRSRSYTVTAPPQVAGSVVVIGNSGAEYGVRGYITAYDLETGAQAWRFFIVPGDPKKGFEHPEMEIAAQTWDPNSDWASGGGGTVWGELAYDPDLNLLYVGTGNASPYPIWFRSPSGGDNLFLASILAINPDTGRLAWHYQTTPGEMWDHTATMNIILADLEIEGVLRKVLMQAPKNGFFYVLDRATGAFLSAEPYVEVNWASHVDKTTGRPVPTGLANYREEPKLIRPADLGGHSWMPMSYSPQTGLVYIPAIEASNTWASVEDYVYKPGEMNMGVTYLAYSVDRELLKAWNPVTQQEVWQVPLTGRSNGGVLSTAGNLVFQGTATGTFVAYRADNGEKLKEIRIGTSIMAAPISYAIDGEQYVAVMAGFGGAMSDYFTQENAAFQYQNYGRILAFKLNGGVVPLPPQRVFPDVPAPPEWTTTPASLQQGQALYLQYCAGCHGWMEPGLYTLYPDLTALTAEVHASFNQIVREGLLQPNGMASFADVLSEEDVDAIHGYLVSVQRDRYAGQANP